jgi:hypothetical protein
MKRERRGRPWWKASELARRTMLPRFVKQLVLTITDQAGPHCLLIVYPLRIFRVLRAAFWPDMAFPDSPSRRIILPVLTTRP